MDWTVEARQELENMPADGKQLVPAARAELITAVDPTIAALTQMLTCRSGTPRAHLPPPARAVRTSPTSPVAADGWSSPRHADPQISVTDAFWA